MKNERTGAYLMMITSVLIFGTIGIFRRMIPLSSGLLAFWRGVIGALFLVLVVKCRGKKLFHRIGLKKTLLLALGGVMIGANWIMLFESYNYTSIAIGTLCCYMAPMIVILLSPLFFKERLTLRKLLCILVAVVGMSLISGVWQLGGIGASDIKGILFGLGSAVLYAGAIILNKVVDVEDAYERTVIQLTASSVVMIPYLLLTKAFSSFQPDGRTIVLVLIMGIVHTGLAYALFFAGMKHLKAQSISILSYLDPVCAVILSMLVLHEDMNAAGIIGAVCIIGAALISEIDWKTLRHKPMGKCS